MPREFFTLVHQTITERIIGFTIEDHGAIGPVPLESVYVEYIAQKVACGGVIFEAQTACSLFAKS
jgi:hypothetical protein